MTKRTAYRRIETTIGGLVMSREKGTRNAPQDIIDEIVAKHKAGATRREMAEEYEKPYKTMKNMCIRENNKARRKEADPLPKTRGRKAAVSLQKCKYENN